MSEDSCTLYLLPAVEKTFLAFGIDLVDVVRSNYMDRWKEYTWEKVDNATLDYVVEFFLCNNLTVKIMDFDIPFMYVKQDDISPVPDFNTNIYLVFSEDELFHSEDNLFHEKEPAKAAENLKNLGMLSGLISYNKP